LLIRSTARVEQCNCPKALYSVLRQAGRFGMSAMNLAGGN